MNASILATRSFSLHLKLFVAAFACALALALVPAPAHAATLTSAQINGVLGLLSAFNVPQATIDNVRSILGGGTATAPATQTQTPSTQTQTPAETTQTPSETRTSTPATTGSDRTESSCKEGLSSAQVSQMQSWVSLYDRADIAYNDLWKAIAKAAHAPAGYISSSVSPTITQGAGVTDSLDGRTILRADLYFGHDEAAKARTAAQCAALATCTTTYALPSTHASAQGALSAYYNAIFALPKFSGPAGMMTGGTQRVMGYIDYNTVKAQLAKAQAGCSAAPTTSTAHETDNDTPSSVVTNPETTSPAAPVTSSAKPDAAHFVAAAHTDVSTASSMLYGVIGSNTDVRDWATIMASPDPLATARALTSAMYNSGSRAYLAPGATRPQDRSGTTILGSAGNFTFYKEILPGNIVNYVLALVDANGYQLTSAANPDVLARLIINFGFDKSALAQVQAQVTAKGINLQSVTSWPHNFMPGVSSSGIDASSMMAAAAAIPLSATTDALNILADQIGEINFALANVLSAYAALLGF